MTDDTQTPRFDSRRSDAIEQLLRDTVDGTPHQQPARGRRPSTRLVLASIAAFALAGALTGGAVASAATVSAQQAATEAGVRGAALESMTMNDGSQLGRSLVRSASSTLILQLGAAPTGANAIIEAVQCQDPASLEESVDGKDAGGGDCGTGETDADIVSFTGTGDHAFMISDPDRARFTVWIGWAKFPALTPSSQEKALTADGIVTRDEELAAYNAYSVCMTTLGYPIVDLAELESGIEPQASISNDAVESGADNRCWQTQFRGADVLWQNEVESGQVAVKSIDTCLKDNSVDAAATPAARMKQFDTLSLNWQDGCTWVG